MGLFSTANKNSQIGVDFLTGGVAVAEVQTGRTHPGHLVRSAFVEAVGQQAQVEALKNWIKHHNLQKTPCVCLVAGDDRDVYQVDKPEVDDTELLAALTWKIKDLINYDVTHAVVDCYPIPTSSKNNRQQLSVVAAREAVIGSYVESIKSCAVKLMALDIHELARGNLELIRNSTEQTLALLTLGQAQGTLGIYHDTDLYVSRDFGVGVDQLEAADAQDQTVFDSLLLEIQRSLDYYESVFGMGPVAQLRIYPQLPVVEKMANYLQNLTNFEIEFVTYAAVEETPVLESQCFDAYCAALRGVDA